MSIGDTLSQMMGNEALRPFTFLCCGLVLNTEGAIFWHSEEITPDTLACNDQVTQDSLEIKQGTVEEARELEAFEDVIVKCEDENSKKFEAEDYFGNVMVEEDPLLVDESPAAKVSNLDSRTVVADNDRLQEKACPGNGATRKHLIGILDQQDALGPVETQGEVNGSAKRTKYPETFTCEFCGKLFTGKERAYQFYYHRNREHLREMIYKCDICAKEFWGDRELLAHIATHTVDGHICHICGQKFNAKKNLKAHLLIHKSVRGNICRYCDKTFRRKDHLTVHERIHTGIRPYQCQWCDSGYPQKHQLKLHIKKCPILRRHETKSLSQS